MAAHDDVRTLSHMPIEVLGCIVARIESVRDLASANAASRTFRGIPGGRSPIEHVLRTRARARGHEQALPATLPPSVCTWTEELFAREHVAQLALGHVAPVACNLAEARAASAFVDADGGLHTCGEGGEFDEDETPTDERPPAMLGHPDASEVLVPTRVDSLSKVRVCSVAAGSGHMLALSDSGAVYACGKNSRGQRGYGENRKCAEFIRVQALASETVVCIAAEECHSLAVTAAGSAYSWGFNLYGQLGHGDGKERREPQRVEALQGVRVGGVAAGHSHSLFLDTGGAVYSCGSSSSGQLGHGEQHDRCQRTPRRIEALAGVRVVHVSASFVHSLVCDAAGGVHSFGAGTFGCLGHGDESHQREPRRVDALAGVHAVRASAGFCCTAVVGADGSVHTFGHSRYGLLGLGHSHGQLLPARVHTLAHCRVAHAAFGFTHALFVTADSCAYSCGMRSAALGLGIMAADGLSDWLEPERISQLPPLSLVGPWAGV